MAAVLMIGGTVAAKPPGETRDEDVDKRLFSFNVIVKPNDWAADDEECPNNCSRIFFQERMPATRSGSSRGCSTAVAEPGGNAAPAPRSRYSPSDARR